MLGYMNKASLEKQFKAVRPVSGAGPDRSSGLKVKHQEFSDCQRDTL